MLRALSPLFKSASFRFVLCLAPTLYLAGCDKPAEDMPAGASTRRTVVIGIIAKSQSNPVFPAAHAGAIAAAAELGPKYGVDVKVEILTPTEEDAVKQAEAIESLTRRKVDGIAIAASEARTVTPAIDKAVTAGIPVVCFDADIPSSKRFSFYGTDDIDCGRTIMRELSAAMGGKGTVAVIAGSEAAPNLQNRLKGVKEELAKHPDIKLLDAGVIYHVETPEKAAEALQMAQRANPQIQAWAFIGGWPLFTNDALKFKPGTIKVVSCDALPAQLNYLRSGHVQALMAQDCYGWGTESVRLILDKVVHDKAPADPRVIAPLTKVTKENVEAFAGSWDKWLSK
jgi:ribose transport system substrate-binding protein